MCTFLISILCLFLGGAIYSRVIERVFGVDDKRKTPAYTMQDGVDFIPMPTWKLFLIQFLNISGTGPIFGAILGIMYGPSAYLWIVLGCIFAGVVHDYFAGAISIRGKGKNLSDIIGDELGKSARITMLILLLLLVILVGAVFTTTPAGLLANLTPTDGFWGGPLFWSIVIIVYYILATLLPINELIGRIYPVFGFVILVMGIGVLYGIFSNTGFMPEITDAFSNHHPNKAMPLYPGICVTIACGAISGFHATQSPLLARCIKTESAARKVFAQAMLAEGFIAIIWAAGAIKFADCIGADGNTPYEKVMSLITDNGAHSANPAILVNELCQTWIGSVGAVLAILGVVVAPITSGDTSFRVGRLIIADALHFRQNKVWRRLVVALPMFVLSIIVMLVDFQVLWRYFSWFNQSISIFTFWSITVWLARNGKRYIVSLVPAMWMSATCMVYILVAPEGFQLAPLIGNIVGVTFALALAVWFFRWKSMLSKRI